MVLCLFVSRVMSDTKDCKTRHQLSSRICGRKPGLTLPALPCATVIWHMLMLSMCHACMHSWQLAAIIALPTTELDCLETSECALRT